MGRYLTVLQYHAADEGLSLDNVTDLSLARYIARAEADIDSFCGFDLYYGGFEPHMVTTQAPWDEKRLRSLAPTHPVPVRQVTRYRIQVSNISTAGAGFFAGINTSDCVVNVTQGYVEIVPLQAVTYSLSPVILQLALKPPIVQMDVEVGWFLGAFGDPLINDGNNLTYRSLRGGWLTSAGQYTQASPSQPAQLPAAVPNVYSNGSLLSASLYSITATEGAITFATARAGSEVITADYCYQIPDSIRDATILQTTYLLGQRALNIQGLQGLESVRSGKQTAKRHMSMHGIGGIESVLALEAAAKIAPYVAIPIG